MQSNYIHQAQMIVHFTSQQSDAKFTVRCGASSSLHNPSLLSRQQISHTNFGRIVTRMCYAVTGPVSSGLLLVSLWCCGSDCCRVCCTDVTVTTPTSVWEAQGRQLHHPDCHHHQCSVYRHCRNYSETIRVHQTLIVCWRPLWVRLEPKNMKSK